MPREADANAVLAELPRERASRRFEVRQQRDAAFEGGQLARGDGEETRIIEGAVRGDGDASALVSPHSFVCLDGRSAGLVERTRARSTAVNSTYEVRA